MEREDETSTGRYTEDVAPGDAPDRPAGPSQPDDGFAEGAERRSRGEDEPDFARGGDRPRDPDAVEREPDFARGIDRPHDDSAEAEGRYSRGAEAPGTEEASHEGRFSEGIEQLPHED
jgi:hypothetical protein